MNCYLGAECVWQNGARRGGLYPHSCGYNRIIPPDRRINQSYAANLTDFGGASDMNQKQRAEWERIRAKGMWRYVLLRWVLFWGVFMIIFWSVYRFFVRGLGFLDDLKFIVPIFLVVGFLGGLVTWRISENKYRKSSSNAPSS
jgi:hypothetical protein